MFASVNFLALILQAPIGGTTVCVIEIIIIIIVELLAPISLNSSSSEAQQIKSFG